MKPKKETKVAVMDLTIGSPIIKIITFAIPLVFGTLFQQLYSFVDTVIVGRFISINALASIGTTYSLNFLIFGFVQGLCVGFGIPLAKSYGSKDLKKLNKFFNNAVSLSIIVSIILTALMLSTASLLLRVMNTPTELFTMARNYILIIFLGLPLSILYNFSASALRAVGDSKHPFYYLLLSSALNIVLDYIFIVVFKWGIEGAAAATVLSQGVSGALNCYALKHYVKLYKLSKEDLRLEKQYSKELLRIGLPMGIEYSISAIGAIVMQDAINTLGTIAVAAQTTGEKIRQMFTLPMEAVGMAMATYVGQNHGAGKIDRIKKGIKSGLMIQYIYCVVAFLLIYALKYPLVSLVLGVRDGEVAFLAAKYLTLMSTLFFIHGSLMIMRNTLQGMGYSVEAIISGVGELVGRSLGGILAIIFSSFTLICFTNPIAWGLALLYCIIMVSIKLKKITRAKISI